MLLKHSCSLNPFLASTMLFLLISHLNSILIPATSSYIYTTGRSYKDPQGNFIGFNWPCFQIQVSLKGEGELFIELVDSWNRFEVFHNKVSVLIFEANSSCTNYSLGQISGQVDVKVVKITENHYGPFGSSKASLFYGFWLDASKISLEKNIFEKKRKIEVFSDSDSNGYGIDSQGTSVYCLTHMKQVQNCQQGWAYSIGTTLNAEMHIEAWSGKGVVKNAIGIGGTPMPEDWTKVTTNSIKGSWEFPPSWVPQAVLVWLGTNDRINPKQPQKETFIQHYYQMLNEIYQSYAKYGAQTPKIIALGIQYENENKWIQEAVQQFQKVYIQTSYIKIPFNILKIPQDFGCLFHINQNGQNKIAAYLAPLLEKEIYSN